ncbi:unnamed protein product [Hermetia illucens]|uniref:Uncharacterized protein n=1 Tax=Hermetia illucens TaxID=343691 RepID=A0A7R8YVB2_HERIL|nr:unnamed protein product [Hermetia illucens]
MITEKLCIEGPIQIYYRYCCNIAHWSLCNHFSWCCSLLTGNTSSLKGSGITNTTPARRSYTFKRGAGTFCTRK